MIKTVFKMSQNLKVKIIFYLSIYFTYTLIYLNYDIVYSPDFEKYFNYFLFYSGDVDVIKLEQGNLYFFFIYIITFLLGFLTTEIGNFELLNISVLLGNYFIYLLALVGLRNYLVEYNFDEKKVYLSLIILNFSPPTLILRMTFKPEILGFTLIIWSLFYLKLFNTEKNQKNLNLFLFFSIFVTTLKVSIFLMYVILILLHIDLKKFLHDIRPYIRNVLLIILIFFSLHVENYLLNKNLIFEVSHEEKYNNVADFEFFTNFNSNEINDNPQKNFHNNSFRAITLLDTFSDYFELYWNSDHSSFNTSRKQVIIFQERIPNFKSGQLPTIKYDKNDRVITYIGDLNSRYIAEDEGENTLDEIRMRGAFFFTIIFYIFTFISSFRYKKLRALLLSPLIGMILVSASSIGVFTTKNFDPSMGDSVKTFYYSFLISLSFVILLNILLKTIKGYDFIFTFLIILFFLFVIGLPTNFNEEVIDKKIEKNSYLFTCEINQIFIEFDEILNYKNCDIENKNNFTNKKFNNLSLRLSLLRVPYLTILLFSFLPFYIFSFRKKLV